MLVLVTRPRAQAEATAQRLSALGHEAILAPVMEVVATGEPPPPGPFAALLVTSANAVPALAAARRVFAEAPVLAVGPSTGAALRRAGFADVREAGGDARSLAGLALGLVPERARLLHLGGRIRKEEPGRTLAEAGCEVRFWEIYDTRPARALPREAAEALRAGTIGAVLHYSRRSAAIFGALAAEAGIDLGAVRHLCLSADVAAALHGARPGSVSVPARPDEAHLLALLAAVPAGSPLPQSRC